MKTIKKLLQTEVVDRILRLRLRRLTGLNEFLPRSLHPTGEYISDEIRRRRLPYEVELLFKVASIYDYSRFVDCGANVGNHSLFFESLGAVGWCFEPSKASYNLLSRNVSKFDCFNVALGAAQGKATLRTFNSSFGNSHLSENFGNANNNWGSGTKTEEIYVETLDSFPIQAPTLVKIDVEGSELLVLQGATRILKEYSPAIWIEIHSDATLIGANFPYRRSDIENFLEKFGYRHHRSLDATNHFFIKPRRDEDL